MDILEGPYSAYNRTGGQWSLLGLYRDAPNVSQRSWNASNTSGVLNVAI